MSETVSLVTSEQIVEALKTVYDPEIPLSIVDLGLIYDVKAHEGNVLIKMTLTTQGCGMGDRIASQAQKAVMALAGVERAIVEIVWEPKWNPEMMSPEAKKKLGFA